MQASQVRETAKMVWNGIIAVQVEEMDLSFVVSALIID